MRTLAIGLLLTAALAAQEHSYTPADVENGSRLYQSSCAGCHGPGGDMVPGVELLRGQFRRAAGDTEIIGIIQKGIPGTTMPPSSFTEAQALTIVAFLRSGPAAGGRGSSTGSGRGGRGGGPSGPAVPPGDVARGRALFDGKGQCATCHRVNGVGPRVAPDLSDIGVIRQPRELQEKLVNPSAMVRPTNRMVEIVMKDGTKVTGHLLNQDTFSIQVLDSAERLRSIPRANVREFTVPRESPMPSYRDMLNPQEVADVVAYLASLRGRI